MWIGNSLGLVERACLRSVARQGHTVALYCYSEPEGVPQQVEIRDASTVIPYEKISSWRDRPNLYSDWFRYELLARGLGTWVDADMYLLAPLNMKGRYLFGVEKTGLFLNTAVLRLPSDSQLLTRLVEPFRRRTTPRYMPWYRYYPRRLHELLTGHVDYANMPWGTTGPLALSSLARDLDLWCLAEPMECFYPVPWQKAEWIRDPKVDLQEVVTEATVAIHLWNRCIQHFKNEPPPAGSFLERLHREGA